MTEQVSYGANLETCAECKAVAHLFSLTSLLLLRDERPNFNHIHDEGGKLVAFSSAHRARDSKRVGS